MCTGLVEVESGVWCVLGEWRYSLEYGVYWGEWRCSLEYGVY